MKIAIAELVVPLTLCLTLAAAPPAAGDRVSGVVRDGAHEKLVPIPAALVLCRSENNFPRIIEVHTDGNGAFTCDDVETGVVTLEYRKLGYVPRDDVERIDVDGAAKVELRLYEIEPVDSSYWVEVAMRILERNETDYVDAIERLAEIGLSSRSVGLVADRVARSLPPVEAAIFETQITARFILLERRRFRLSPGPGYPPATVPPAR